MTLSEFKAWFDGFTESMDGPPGPKAWERIQARVKEITGNPITERVYVERYRDWLLDTYPRPYRAYYSTGMPMNGVGNAVFSGGTATSTVATCFNGSTAMNALGRAESALLECAA